MEEQEPNELKEDPRDFALWKATKEDEDTSWDSPWGMGRPGWHIECSAMAAKLLGPAFEIHGGGIDLVFPHHENELAQSNAAGQEFARIWMHNGLLRLTGEKMSKSLGNIQTLEAVLNEWGRETLLLFFMTAHWRSPIDFSRETMMQARTQVDSFRELFRMDLAGWAPPQGWDREIEAQRFDEALDNDFNSADALAILHGARAARDQEFIRERLGIFGLESLAAADEEAPAEIVDLAVRRQAARAGRDFAESDRLRDEIAAAGWEVRDIAAAPGYQLVKKG